MTKDQALQYVHAYGSKGKLNEDEEFMYTESLRFLIEETEETRWMVELGGYYYELRDFDLALKYYEMADRFGDRWAPEGLGYIWYYGRTGTRDYEKAFHYYSKAAELGSIKSRIKVADMYKNGYYVDQSYDEYCRIIEECYPLVKKAKYLGEPKPEIFTRLAAIRKEQGRTEEAVRLYQEAKEFLRQRIVYTQFFGDLTIMKYLIRDLYALIEPDPADLDLYDLYYLLEQPGTVTFYHLGLAHEVLAVREEAGIAVAFDGEWYRDADAFFRKAAIDGEPLTVLDRRLYGFSWKKGRSDG